MIFMSFIFLHDCINNLLINNLYGMQEERLITVDVFLNVYVCSNSLISLHYCYYSSIDADRQKYKVKQEIPSEEKYFHWR